ncbi:hypothetical protein OOT46_21390, partial [Aquabacterium sp. A7-Y]|uniref:hypothetical protein n=1 Tax=Aquabacterium sp. A7-Y TaxID=1349605 RepID=UPI00223DCF7C
MRPIDRNRSNFVFLAITPAGLVDALRVASRADAVCRGSDAITEAGYAALKLPTVSRFIYALADRQLV